MNNACNHVNTHYEAASEFSHDYEVCDGCGAAREVDEALGLPFEDSVWED